MSVATFGANSFSYDSGAAFSNLAGLISTGSSISSRVGNCVRLQRLKWNLSFAAGDNTNIFRFLVLRAKGVNSVPTSASTMSASVFGGNTGSTQVYAPVDITVWDVLHDELNELHYAPVDGSTATSIAIPRCSKGDISLV